MAQVAAIMPSTNSPFCESVAIASVPKTGASSDTE
jgi:hypothetical protein